MKKIFLTLSFILMIGLLLTSPLHAFESLWIDTQILKNPMFEKALCYCSAGDNNTALEEFQKIIDRYPGTEYAANAQLCKISIYEESTEFAKAAQECQAMQRNYPNTRYWLIAKRDLQLYQSSNYESWLAAENKLITDTGGESIYKIQGNSQDYDVSQVAPQYRMVLAECYSQIALGFERDKNFEDAVKIFIFVRQNFPLYQRIDVEGNIVYCVGKLNNVNTYDIEDTTPPQITIDSPHHGNRVHGLKPRIQVGLQDGDIMAAQVNLSKLIFTLDGQNLTDKMKVHCAVNTSAQPGVTFEKIKIVYKPESPLAVGSHTVYVKAEDYGGRSGEKTWTFTIVKPELYRDGEEEN